MAEIIGLLASVASLIAFTSETSKACSKLAENIASFKNAQTDIQKIKVELFDLAQILELIESVLQPLQEDRVGVQGHLELVEKSLARIKTGVQEIAEVLIAVQPTARGSSTKVRAKWIYKKSDLASMISIIDRQKQGLLLQFNLLNAKFAHTTHADLRDFRRDLKQIAPRTEDLATSITTSISESTSRFEDVVQASATSLQSSIKHEIYETVRSIPRESDISQASLQTLSVLVSNIVSSRLESLELETSLKYPGSRSCTQIESAQRPPNKPQTEDIRTMTRSSQATIDDSRNEEYGHFNPRKEGSSRVISRTSVQTMTSIFGRVVIRRSTVKVVCLDSDPEIFSDGAKVEIDFLPASWLRYWTGCGIFLARMGFGKPTVDINFTVARVLDFDSHPETREALDALKIGDMRKLIGFLQRKVVYPTDRDLYGYSLLSIAAKAKQLEICELLLQQGAAVDINTPDFRKNLYPIEFAISSSTLRKDHDFVRLFLKYDADVIIDNDGSRWGGCFAMLPFEWECAETHETRSLFGLLVDNDPSFDINQRFDGFDWTDLVFTRNHPLQVYEDLIRVGVGTKALCRNDSTVLHYFFQNMFWAEQPLIPVDVFLDGAEIVALLIQAGADPQATDSSGNRPKDVSCYNSCFPDKKVETRIYTAIWHQALKICGLSGSKYCDCPVHHQEEIIRRYDGSYSPSRRWGLDDLLPYETFEEEMSAALREWDSASLRRHYPSHPQFTLDEELYTLDEHLDLFEKWIQEVLIKLQARQNRTSSNLVAAARQPAESHPSERRNREDIKRDEMQPSDHLNMNRSVQLTDGSDPDEDWETNSSSSSSNGEEENWESAPET